MTGQRSRSANFCFVRESALDDGMQRYGCSVPIDTARIVGYGEWDVSEGAQIAPGRFCALPLRTDTRGTEL